MQIEGWFALHMDAVISFPIVIEHKWCERRVSRSQNNSTTWQWPPLANALQSHGCAGGIGNRLLVRLTGIARQQHHATLCFT